MCHFEVCTFLNGIPITSLKSLYLSMGHTHTIKITHTQKAHTNTHTHTHIHTHTQNSHTYTHTNTQNAHTNTQTITYFFHFSRELEWSCWLITEIREPLNPHRNSSNDSHTNQFKLCNKTFFSYKTIKVN